jgi:hypothetical protein
MKNKNIITKTQKEVADTVVFPSSLDGQIKVSGGEDGIIVKPITKAIPVELPVMQKIAGIKKEYENLIGKQLGSDDKDDWDKVIYIDFEGLWNWIEEKLKSNFSA